MLLLHFSLTLTLHFPFTYYLYRPSNGFLGKHCAFSNKFISEVHHTHILLFSETLRKYSAMGWMDRISDEDYKIDDNLTIKARTPVLINAIGMHYDPKYFPNPERFNPDRFMPENEENIQPYTFLPFGDGPRICIGKYKYYCFVMKNRTFPYFFINK